MPQYFPPIANALAKWTVIGGLIFTILLITTLTVFARTTNNRVRVPVAQPIGFQHSLHAGELGLDCRYCHTSVEVSATASVPSTETCMTCHSQIRVGAPALQPVVASWEGEIPIRWNRVHDLADFVFFNHSAHYQQRGRMQLLPRPGRRDGWYLEGKTHDHGLVPRLPSQPGKIRPSPQRGV